MAHPVKPPTMFDHLSAVAAELFDAPMAFVTMVDENGVWCRSAFGAEGGPSSHEDSFCAHTVALGTMLLGLDMEVETFADGAEAVDAATHGRFDLILMDVHMPVMDGIAATTMIRQLAGAAALTPVLALTANAQPEHISRCLAAGMNGYITKPVNFLSLVETLAPILVPPCANEVVLSA